MKKKHNIEEESEKGYVRLVAQMILNIFDRIRIKKSWHSKKISRDMIQKKREDIALYKDWLETDNAEFWFKTYGNCTNRNGLKMLNDFKIIVRKSTQFLDTLELSEAAEGLDSAI